MKFRIQSRAKSSQIDRATERVRSRLIYVNEVLEFDHHPSGEEILSALASLPRYKSCMVQFLETIAIHKLAD